MTSPRLLRRPLVVLLHSSFILSAVGPPSGLGANTEHSSRDVAQQEDPRYTRLISNGDFLLSDAALEFDTQAFLDTQDGPLKGFREKLSGATWSAAETIRYNAVYFGINPQVLIVVLEAHAGVITDPNAQVPQRGFTQNGQSPSSLFGYVQWLSSDASHAFYARRYHESDEAVSLPSGETIAVPTKLNGGSYAIQTALALGLARDQWDLWVLGSSPEFVRVFSDWFADPLLGNDQSHDPALALTTGYSLPFPIGETWYYTGGPHNYVGGIPGCLSGSACPRPWSAVDIAQPEIIPCPGGSYPPNRWITATKSGTVVQSSQALVVIDHGDGWRTYYSHVSSADRRGPGAIFQGDTLGHPSCETEPGGSTSGVHVHFASYQVGIGFVDISGSALSDWRIQESTHYNGTMTRLGETRTASTGRTNGFNDIYHSGSPCPQSGGVILYKHASFDCGGEGAGSGYVQLTGLGLANLASSFNDQASSVRVQSGWSVMLHEHTDRGGASACRNGDDTDFTGDSYDGGSVPLNDSVSSLVVFDNPNCGGGGDTVVVFENPGFAGMHYGWHDPGWFNLPDYLNDKTSSLSIVSGWSARVFEHNDRGGGQTCYDSSAPDLGGSTFDNGVPVNDHISSIEVYQQETCPASDKVTLYQNPSYLGTTYGWHDPGWFNLVDYMNDISSSISIASGWSARLYEHNDRGGGRKCFDASDSDFSDDTFDNGATLNDAASSIELYDQEDCPSPPLPICPPITSWKGEYWNNDSLSGQSTLCRDDSAVDFEWFAGSPDPLISDDHFSARWTQSISFEGGFYTFHVFHDDGFRFYVDGGVLFQNWCSDCRMMDSYTWLLASGVHEIKLEMFENQGWAGASLTWQPYQFPTPSSTPTPTPTSTPSPTVTPTPTNTWTPTVTSTSTSTPTPVLSDLIFSDSFESAGFSAWSASKRGGGDLGVSAPAAMVGDYGMQVLLDDSMTIYVTDETPGAERQYRARFYFDPNSISMANGDDHSIFTGYMSTSTAVLRIQFRFNNNGYKIRGATLLDNASWRNSPWFAIGDEAHFIELDWRAASAADANDGGLVIWIDGVRKANLAGLDSDAQRIDRVRLGSVTGIDDGTRGTYYFDAFESRRFTYIGP